MFAKIFEGSRGQILVKVDASEDGSPEVRLYVQPEGFGVNSVAYGFDDSDEGWDKAEQGFKIIDQDMAEKAVADVYEFTDNM